MNTGFEFLTKRGISEETSKTFGAMYFLNGVMYANPNETFSPDFFRSMKKNIMSFTNEDNSARFNNCVLFPLMDAYFNFISVFARRLEGTPKFDAMPFSKKSMLYGLNESYRHIFNKEHVYITEGIFDFMIMWQYGVHNVVSSLGCSLHYEQMCLLSRFAREFTVIYDPDSAGKEGMAKAKDMITKNGYKCNTVYLPENLDLDDFIIKYGMERLLKNAKTTLAL